MTGAAIGVKKSGARDNATVKKGSPRSAEINVSLVPNAASWVFFKDFISDNPGSTWSIVIKEDDGETFQTANGCVVEKFSWKVATYPKGTEVTWDITLRGRIMAFAESGAFYDTTNTNFYSWEDVTVALGASGGSPTTLTNWLSVNATITQEVDVIPDNTGATADIRTGTRQCTAELVRSVVDSGTTESGELVAGTLKMLRLTTAAGAFTMDDCLYEEVEIEADRAKNAMKNMQLFVGDLAVT
jgi:hypothetical protein